MTVPNDFNTSIIEEFRANEGRVSGRFEGAPMILVHHAGAKSGIERITPLVYFPDGEHMVIIGSAAGAPSHPAWYYNLMANPRAAVEVGTEKFAVDITELTGDEREQAWSRVVAAMPGFGEYQQQITRLIPVLALTRAA